MLCQLFGVSRSRYDKWRCLRENPNRYQVSQQILDGYIKALHETHPALGPTLWMAACERRQAGALVILACCVPCAGSLYTAETAAILTQGSHTLYFLMFLINVSIQTNRYPMLPLISYTSCTMACWTTKLLSSLELNRDLPNPHFSVY